MKISDIFLPLALAIATTFALKYFIFDRNTGATDPTQFVVRTVKEEVKPVSTEMDFLDQKATPETTTAVSTSWADLTFSNHGATLIGATFNRISDGKEMRFVTTDIKAENRENRAFLVALPDKTPYYYTFAGKDESEDTITLTYSVDAPVHIEKKFVIYKSMNKIDLKLKVDSQDSIDVRLVWPAPFLDNVEKNNIDAIVIDTKGSFVKTDREAISRESGWIKPTLFGTADRYFVYAMVNDGDSFAQRAYYLVTGQHQLISFIESEDAQKIDTQLSFYFGPKESSAMVNVDPRLEKTLSYYGIFAPISKMMLALLEWLNQYMHSFGLSIILLTLLINLILLPFTWRTEQTMQKSKEMQKKLEYLQKKYKNDPQTFAQERAELIRKHGMPGLGGCLPLLLQIPLFFALSRVLTNSIEFYKVPFLWIPDLSSPDPYYVLPLSVGFFIIFRALSADTQQQVPGIVMGLVFGAVTASFSAGLALYIAVNTALSIVQARITRLFTNKGKRAA